MNYDDFLEVINGDDTYSMISMLLKVGRNVFIGWTDECCSHYDILLCLGAEKFGTIQRGIKSNYLFVSIIGYTSHAFNIESEKMGGYIQEKLNMMNESGDKLKELINGVIRFLNKED